MATKPTETLNFEPSGTAVVAVPSGKQTAGFLPGEKPPAQYLNWLFRTFSRLYNYVKDGQFTGNHTIDGTLSTTGAFTSGGLVTASGGVAVPTAQAVTLSGTTTLTVGTGAVAFGGLLSANAGITTQSLTLTGTDTLKHPNRELVISASAFRASASATTCVYESFTSTSPTNTYTETWRFGTAGSVVTQLPLRVGDRVVGLQVTLGYAGIGGSNAIVLEIISDGCGTTGGGTAGTTFVQFTQTIGSISPAGVILVGSSSGVNITVQSNTSYQLRVRCNAATNNSTDVHLIAAKLLYDRP